MRTWQRNSERRETAFTSGRMTRSEIEKDATGMDACFTS